MKIPERIPKLVIKPIEIDGPDCFGLNLNDNTLSCSDCNSNLFYVKIDWGVVEESHDYGIMGNRSNSVYCLREVGFILYCAECGAFEEHFVKWFYPKDKLVCHWNEISGAEKVEIEYCLNQWNQKGDFKPQWKCAEANILKEKLKEYEKKNPIKNEKKKTKRRK